MPGRAKRRRFVVSGRVQGVGFRWFVRESGERLGLHGWTRNCPDGTVEVEAEGRPEALAEFARRLMTGPGHVDGVAETALPPEGGSGSFRIIL
jgi:acylphosphatase